MNSPLRPVRSSFGLLPLAILALALGPLGASSAGAQSDDVVVHNLDPQQRALSPAQVLRVPPFANPLRSPDLADEAPDLDAGRNAPGARGKDGFDLPDSRAFGTFGIPYTTTRVSDGARSALGTTNASRLSTTYPYRTVGKLTFSAGFCSASLIRRSVIVTAAHCIQNFGSGANIFSNFQFTPGHYGAAGATAAQIAPHGTWSWLRLVRPGSWSNGTDIGSGAARDNDLALIALNRNASGQFIGDLTGTLGYGWNNYSFVTSANTGNLHTAATSTLGYPGLMDGGVIMQRADGPTYTTTIAGAGQLRQGNNFTGGSSGGPWVVNFRSRAAVLSGGAVAGSASVIAVIGVTSWGSSDPNLPKDNYSSQFRQNTRYPNASYGIYGAGNIGSLLNTLCSSGAPGGGTLASTGYCD